jgi:multimeric flavodoxin WrbA
MKVYVISSSPNKDGLTAACADAAIQGIQSAGGLPTHIRINDLRLGQCKACNNGWGTCQEEHRCQEEDDFQSLHASLAQVDALVLITPVYWGEMSESAKAFTDRFRRCEATRPRGESYLFRKPVIAVAAAGGGGGGMVTCLGSMERWTQHITARVFDLIPVNRWSREYKLAAIREAARTMVQVGFKDSW